MQNKEYTPEICGHCKQTIDYENSLDKGSEYIVIAIANAQSKLKLKEVHLREKMLSMAKDYQTLFAMVQDGKMTESMIQNVLRPKYHGLIAQGRQSGTYLITAKGAKFLRDETVVRTAIIDKVTHSKKYYWDLEDTVKISELLKFDEIFFWEGEESKLKKLSAYFEKELEQPTMW